MPAGYKIRGIAPYELRNYPDAVKLQFWGWVVEYGLKAKDRDLARGLDAVGEPLRPILPATRRNRRSEMTPSGKGDPSAPPLMPGRKLSRTRSLLAGRAFTTHAEFYWRYDAWTGDTWAVILTYHKRMGRDVFGLSDDSLDLVRRQCLAKWQRWKREGGAVPAALAGKRVLGPAPGVAPKFEPSGKLDMTYATLGINVPADLTMRRGGMTEAELKAYYRGTAPASVQGRPSAGYNRLLAHAWGQGPQGPTAGGAVVPIPPRPKPAPPPKPEPKPEPEPEPMTLERFAAAAYVAARSVPVDQRYHETRVWISDAYARFAAFHPEISFAEFKRLLVEANMRRLITLARSDLPGHLSPADFAKDRLSETFQGTATFHWIRL